MRTVQESTRQADTRHLLPRIASTPNQRRMLTQQENYSTEILSDKLVRVMPQVFKQIKGVPPNKRGKLLEPMITQMVASLLREDPQFRISDIPWDRLIKIVFEKYSQTCSPAELIAIRGWMEQQD